MAKIWGWKLGIGIYFVIGSRRWLRQVGIPIIASGILILGFIAIAGCGQVNPTAETTTTTTCSSTSTSTTTSSTTSTTVFSTISGTVKVPASVVSSGIKGLAADGVSDTALSGAIVTAVDISGNRISGTSIATTDANGSFTITNVPTNMAFYIKATKEASSSNIIVVKDIATMEGSSTKTGEDLNAKSTMVAQRINSILSATSAASFESIRNISPVDTANLLDFQAGALTAGTTPNLKGASENAVASNVLTTYNSLTAESSTLEAIDSSVNAQLLVGAASSANEYKIAAWKFFAAAGFAVPTIESLSLTGHAGINSAMPTITEAVLDTMASYLLNDYRWNVSGILAGLNYVASWEVHYTQTASPTSAASHEVLLPAILTAHGGTVAHTGIMSNQSFNAITGTYTPQIEEGAFGNLLYGQIPTYEGFIATVKSMERPSSPTWETPSIIAVATLAFPASFWDTTPTDSSDNRTFDANTRLNILQSYAIIYYRQLKIEPFTQTGDNAPYYNHQLRIQFANTPGIEATLLERLLSSKL